MKKHIAFIILFTVFLQGYGQDNIGTPYSIYGYGLPAENTGPYAAMGGVSAALRDSDHINFLNPASYTALDSNRFYFQFGLTGEVASISTYNESGSYRVAQNSAINIAFRIYNKLFFSFGFTEKSDIGYDLLFTMPIPGSYDAYFNQNVEGEGGINDVYMGFAWRFKNLSIGLNSSYLFGKIEKQQTLSAMLENSYRVRTSDNIRVHDILFTPGLQYVAKISPKSVLTLGGSFNLTQKISAKQEFTSYIINSGTGAGAILDQLELKKGYIKYPMRILSGFNYTYKNKLNIAGDYTFQKMSDYEEFKKKQELQDYHKAALGVSWIPERYGRSWWQRNKYMLGTYFVRSAVNVKNKDINTYALTYGVQMPFMLRSSELLLGINMDLGIRGTESNGLIREKFGKLRVNISFKELWFMKRKIN